MKMVRLLLGTAAGLVAIAGPRWPIFPLRPRRLNT